MHHSAHTPEDMLALGNGFAQSAKPGDIFALCGDLGAGKTHWTKGFVGALHADIEVTSPTFGLLHEYPTTPSTIYHFDFYRMDSEEEVIALGWDEILDQDGIVIVEWADLFPDLLPAATRWLQFTISADGTRKVLTSASCPMDSEP